MSNLIGLAVVKHKLGNQKLYEVPAKVVYRMNIGDEVICEGVDPDDVQCGTVVAVDSFIDDGDTVKFLLAEHHEQLPLKRILTKIEYIKLKWEEE